jgi:hypothetical protein
MIIFLVVTVEVGFISTIIIGVDIIILLSIEVMVEVLEMEVTEVVPMAKVLPLIIRMMLKYSLILLTNKFFCCGTNRKTILCKAMHSHNVRCKNQPSQHLSYETD